jgi:hypothetical protein
VITALAVRYTHKPHLSNKLKSLSRALTILTFSLMLFSSLNLGFSIGIEVTYLATPQYDSVRMTIFLTAALAAVAIQAIGCYLIL